MDDIHNLGDQTYNSADQIEEISALEQFKITLNIAFTLVPNLIIAFVLIIYSTLKHLYRLVFPKSPNNIRGQLAVVTGGGNGIGREICMELAREGCNIAVLDMDLSGAERTCHDIRQLGVNAMPYEIDIGDYTQVVAVKKLIDLDLGTTDILVNNAGLLPKVSLREGKPEDLERIINVNITSHFWMVRVFIQDMIARRRGHIVAIASMISFYPLGKAVAYTASKYAVKGFMEALNMEIRDEQLGIKTLTVFPHLVNSRKELITYAREVFGADTLEKVGIRSPKDVAIATVAAIRHGSKFVAVPGFYLATGKIFASLPSSWQDILTETVLPRAKSSKI